MMQMKVQYQLVRNSPEAKSVFGTKGRSPVDPQIWNRVRGARDYGFVRRAIVEKDTM